MGSTRMALLYHGPKSECSIQWAIGIELHEFGEACTTQFPDSEQFWEVFSAIKEAGSTIQASQEAGAALNTPTSEKRNCRNRDMWFDNSYDIG